MCRHVLKEPLGLQKKKNKRKEKERVFVVDTGKAAVTRLQSEKNNISKLMEVRGR